MDKGKKPYSLKSLVHREKASLAPLGSESVHVLSKRGQFCPASRHSFSSHRVDESNYAEMLGFKMQQTTFNVVEYSCRWHCKYIWVPVWNSNCGILTFISKLIRKESDILKFSITATLHTANVHSFNWISFIR